MNIAAENSIIVIRYSIDRWFVRGLYPPAVLHCCNRYISFPFSIHYLFIKNNSFVECNFILQLLDVIMFT